MAALFWLTTREGLHEGISNHFSYALPEDGQRFLMNSYGERLAGSLSNHNLLLMGAHGFLVAAHTPALAWDIGYHLERAVKNYITALLAGREVNILPGHITAKTAQKWEEYMRDTNGYKMHLDAIMDVLDAGDDSYRHRAF